MTRAAFLQPIALLFPAFTGVTCLGGTLPLVGVDLRSCHDGLSHRRSRSHSPSDTLPQDARIQVGQVKRMKKKTEDFGGPRRSYGRWGRRSRIRIELYIQPYRKPVGAQVQSREVVRVIDWATACLPGGESIPPCMQYEQQGPSKLLW